MKNPLTITFSAIKTVFAERCYKIWFAVLFIIFISAYILFPVLHMSSNSVSGQLSALTPLNYFLFFILSSITALLVLLQVFLFSRSKKGRVSALAQSGAGIFSAFFAAILATAACFACVAAILGFLGAGSILFLTGNQPIVVTGVIFLILVGLYLAARRVEGVCKSCEIPKLSNKINYKN